MKRERDDRDGVGQDAKRLQFRLTASCVELLNARQRGSKTQGMHLTSHRTVKGTVSQVPLAPALI
jgi:hypothetical protein